MTVSDFTFDLPKVRVFKEAHIYVYTYHQRSPPWHRQCAHTCSATRLLATGSHLAIGFDTSFKRHLLVNTGDIKRVYEAITHLPDRQINEYKSVFKRSKIRLF
jgi:hypothetical protein